MKITKKEKEFLLSQVQIVLSECQRLVSQLSQIECQEENCPDDEVSSVSSQQSHDLLWDTSEDFPVYSATPSVFYNLVFPEECFDEEMSDFKHCQIPMKSFAKECPFVNKISSFLSSTFPDGVYSKKFKEDLIFVEFQTMWRNVGDLFVQKPDESAKTAPRSVQVKRLSLKLLTSLR